MSRVRAALVKRRTSSGEIPTEWRRREPRPGLNRHDALLSGSDYKVNQDSAPANYIQLIPAFPSQPKVQQTWLPQ